MSKFITFTARHFHKHHVTKNARFAKWIPNSPSPQLKQMDSQFNTLKTQFQNGFDYSDNETLKSACGIIHELINIRHRLEEVLHILDQFPPNLHTYKFRLRTLIGLGRIHDAEELFNEVLENKEITPDVTFCNYLVNGYASCRMIKKALRTIERMIEIGVKPNHVTFFRISDWVYRSGDDALRLKLEEMMNTFDVANHVSKYGGIIKIYCDKKDMESVKRVLNEMHTNGIKPDKKILTTLMDSIPVLKEKLKIFNEMKQKDMLDVVSLTSIITHLMNSGKPQIAVEMFQLVYSLNIKPDEILFVNLIYGLLRSNHFDTAKKYFEAMQSEFGIEANYRIYHAFLLYYTKTVNIGEMEKIISEMKTRNFKIATQIYNLLIRAYFRAEMPEQALRTYNTMIKKNVITNTTTYKTIIQGLCEIGQIRKAVKYLIKINIRPGNIGHVLGLYHHVADKAYELKEFKIAKAVVNTRKKLSAQFKDVKPNEPKQINPNRKKEILQMMDELEKFAYEKEPQVGFSDNSTNCNSISEDRKL